MDPISFTFWRFYYFFRDPKRNPPSGKVIVAPADGYITYVKEVKSGSIPSPIKDGVAIPLHEWGGFFKDEFNAGQSGVLIGIYMTPLSVHINRSPISGKIKRILKIPAKGKNRSMVKMMMRLVFGMKPYEKGSDYLINNARNTIIVDGDLKLAVIQIADSYVKEVDCFVNEGDEVQTGDKIGMIRMGSQCDLFIPHSSAIKIRCKEGEKVYAGESILADY